MARIFISYSRKDEIFARRLATSLSHLGADIWIDIEDIPAGMKWSRAIQEGLDTSNVLIVIISPDSMGSTNVEDEWQYYLDQGKAVVPILLHPAKVHFQLSRIQYIDFHAQGYETALAHLIAELQRNGLQLGAAPTAQYTPVPQSVAVRQSPVTPPPPPAQSPRPIPARPQQSPAKGIPRGVIVGGIVTLLVVIVVAVVMVTSLGSPEQQVEAPTEVAQVVPTDVVQETEPPTDTPTDSPTEPPTSPPTDIPTEPPTAAAALPGYPGGELIAQNAQWKPVFKTFNGVNMVLVPAGCFMIGSTPAQIDAALQMCQSSLSSGCTRSLFEDEAPQQQVCFEKPFWIDLHEVTSAAYGSAGTYSGDTLPRTNVTWERAQRHCESRGTRLPTEAEWEYAARGPDGLVYPWGNDFDGTRLNYCDASCDQGSWRDTNINDGFAYPAPVGTYANGASWVGAVDLAGNVWEWTSTIYRFPYPYNPNDGRENPSEVGSPRVLRGGQWGWISADTRAMSRSPYAGNNVSSDWYGFRCTRDWQPGD